jgi:hypothetical protein
MMTEVVYHEDGQGGLTLVMPGDPIPPGRDFETFALGVTREQLAARFPSYAANYLEKRRASCDDSARAKTKAMIEVGFNSNALGSAHFYPSNETDQQNLMANVVSSMLPDVDENWTTLHLCMSANRVWAYRPHSAVQIQQVGRDGKARIVACLANGAALRAAIASSLNPEAIDIEVGWP